MKKKILVLVIFMLSLCLALLSCSSDKEEEENGSEGLEYELSSDGKSYIVKGIGSCQDKDLVIPGMYNSLPVTAIGENAFSDNMTITSVKLPSGLKSIGHGAFYCCYNLAGKIVLPNNEITVGDFAFEGCSGLIYNSYDNGLYLGSSEKPYLVLMQAKDKYITSCEINSETRQIYTRAFSGCRELKSIKVPEGVVSIGTQAFEDCSSLMELQIPNSVTRIGTGAFKFYPQAFNYNIYDNVKYIGNEENPYLVLVRANDKKQTSFTINENARFISDNAFNGCENLTNIEIPNSVVSIESYAFGFCSSLTSITIGNSVQFIGSYAFCGCQQLESIMIPRSVTKIEPDIFYTANFSLKIYCEAESQPSGWNERWNSSNHRVIWGYKG